MVQCFCGYGEHVFEDRRHVFQEVAREVTNNAVIAFKHEVAVSWRKLCRVSCDRFCHRGTFYALVGSVSGAALWLWPIRQAPFCSRLFRVTAYRQSFARCQFIGRRTIADTSILTIGKPFVRTFPPVNSHTWKISCIELQLNIRGILYCYEHVITLG